MPSNTQPRDMRTWIADLDRANELIRIDKPVDPMTEMGSLLYQSREKALLFENLPYGWRSLGQAPANVRHAALAFGTNEEALVPFVAERLGQCIKPILLNDGPVKELKLERGEFDLKQLPVHVAGRRDGGPVIGSGLLVSKDPDTGQRNVSFHRLQIKGSDRSGYCSIRATPGKIMRNTRSGMNRCRWRSLSAIIRSFTPPLQPPPPTGWMSLRSRAGFWASLLAW